MRRSPRNCIGNRSIACQKNLNFQCKTFRNLSLSRKLTPLELRRDFYLEIELFSIKSNSYQTVQSVTISLALDSGCQGMIGTICCNDSIPICWVSRALSLSLSLSLSCWATSTDSYSQEVFPKGTTSIQWLMNFQPSVIPKFTLP